MAGRIKAHFQNSMGVAKIEVGAHEFMCIGAKPPFDHPHVFLDMGKAEEIICPYCSTLYVLNHHLNVFEAVPPEAVWRVDELNVA